MSSLDEIRNIRLKKLKLLRDKGINPFPISSKQDFSLEKVIKDFSKLSKKKKPIFLIGRIMSIRGQGAIIFITLNDGTGQFQAVFKKDEIEKESLNLFLDTVDIGDFIECKGSLFKTKRKEKSILVKEWRMIVKSLRPLPEKWHGLKDIEERFRKRYLDALMSEEVKERFILRSQLISEMRNILDKAGYLEVETPVLQPIYGGGSAQPFITHHNALDIDFYLRISDELYLKRMLIANFPKVYEISKDFRNEGIDAIHNPEFTMLEFYEAYSDAEKQMKFVEKMLKTVVKKLFKKSNITYDGNQIDFSKKFTVITYFDLLRRYALINNPESISQDELKLKASRLGVSFDPRDPAYKIMDNIFKKVCQPRLIQPTFVIDYPADYLPLAKRKEKNQDLVGAFQLYIGTLELIKAFSELNDPLDQKDRFLSQEKFKEKGDEEAQPLDEDFIEAMEYGLPPAGGVGIGIDRLMMLLTDTQNIKEVIFFPTLRPRSGLS